MFLRLEKVLITAAILTVLFSAGSGMAQTRFARYETTYYTIETDLKLEDVRELAVRATSMFEQYNRIAKSFCGDVRSKRPIMVFKNREDYLAAGASEGSAGIYDPNKKRLLVCFGRYSRDTLWHVVQHEGFHQFADAGPLLKDGPIWINEGLADYFGEGVWTGSKLQVGIVTPSQIQQVQDLINDDLLIPFDKMITMTIREWNQSSDTDYYLQAWSMVYFLLHAENGKYVRNLTAYAASMGKAVADRPRYWADAWKAAFGPDLAEFQKKYCQYWQTLPRNVSHEQSVTALVETMTTFLSRAIVCKQQFKTFDEFMTAATEGKLANRNDLFFWLPPSLLQKAVQDSARAGTWSLETDAATKRQKLLLKLRTGQVFTGSFVPQTNRPPTVNVTVAKAVPGADKNDPAQEVDVQGWQLVDQSKDEDEVLMIPFSKDYTARVRRKSGNLSRQDITILKGTNSAFRYRTIGGLGLPQADYTGFVLDGNSFSSTECDVNQDGRSDYYTRAGEVVRICVEDEWQTGTMKDLNPANGVVTKSGDKYQFDLKKRKWLLASGTSASPARGATDKPSAPGAVTPPEMNLTKKWNLQEYVSKDGSRSLVVPVRDDILLIVTKCEQKPELERIAIVCAGDEEVVFEYKPKGAFGPQARYVGQKGSYPCSNYDHDADGEYDCYTYGDGTGVVYTKDRAIKVAMDEPARGATAKDGTKYRYEAKSGKWAVAGGNSDF